METKDLTIKSLFGRSDVRGKFEELLGKRASAFMTSVLQIASSNELLAKAEPMSVYNAAAVAATLELPLNNNLGFAYIVPYNQKQKDGSYKTVAQFQLGYKGFIQLAQRSGQFQNLSAAPIYEGQLIEQNPLTGYVFDFTKKTSEIVVGYAAYFRLINGFEKVHYMTVDELKKHGKKYSQTFKKDYGLWKDEFDAMASKTVLKLLLAKYAPLSVDMQKAVIADQGVIQDADATEVTYVDNEEPLIDKAEERVTLMINDASTVNDLEKISSEADLTPDQLTIWNEKKEMLSKAEKGGKK